MQVEVQVEMEETSEGVIVNGMLRMYKGVSMIY